MTSSTTAAMDEDGEQSSGSPLYRDPNLQIVFGVALIAILRADSISPGFPGITRELHITSQSVGLIITFFALPSIFLTPVLGVLADRWGRKPILVPSLLLFGVAGGACALARSFEALLALRLLQGIGAASLSMLNITLIADLDSGDKLTTAMGYNASVRSIGSTLYPIIGGALAAVAWYYPFALALLAIPVAFAVLFGLKNPEPSSHQQLGAYLSQMAVSLKTPEVAALFSAGCVVFITMFGAYLTYFPFILEGKFATAAFVIGLFIAARSVVNAIIASQLGKMARVWAVSSLLKTSFLLYALFFLLTPFAESLWMIGLLTLVLGTAEGLYWPSSQAMLGRLAPMEHRAGFMAANDMVLKFGQTIGPLIMGAAFVLRGATGPFLLAALLSILAFVLLALLVKPGEPVVVSST